MTGCYPRRINLHQDHAGQWVLFPRGKRGLNPKEITIAEVLKEAGYSTAIVASGTWVINLFSFRHVRDLITISAFLIQTTWAMTRDGNLTVIRRFP